MITCTLMKRKAISLLSFLTMSTCYSSFPSCHKKRVKPGTFFCSCVDYRISHGCHIANYFQGAIVGIASSFQNNQEEGMD